MGTEPGSFRDRPSAVRTTRHAYRSLTDASVEVHVRQADPGVHRDEASAGVSRYGTESDRGLSASRRSPGDASRVTRGGLQLEGPGRLPAVLDCTAQLDPVSVGLLLVEAERLICLYCEWT
jgi:hypothetical protein